MKPPPTDHPLSLLHICHSCFLLASAGGTRLLIDPYFGGDFRWKGHDEKHVAPEPALRPEQIEGLDGVVITHDHPDHCQPDALYSIMSGNSCGLWGPAGIYRRAVEVGIDNRRVTKLEVFGRITIGDIEILALPNKGSEDAKPCQRMSFLFRSGETSVFHGGDSHGPSPAWAGHVEGVGLALLWPNHVDRAVSFIKPDSVALTHCDSFEPGDFLCGYDAEDIRARLRKRSRGAKVLAPAFGEWFWPERLPEDELRRLRDKPRGRRRNKGRRDRRGDEKKAGSPNAGPAGAKEAKPQPESPTPPPEAGPPAAPAEPQQQSPPTPEAAPPTGQQSPPPPPETPPASTDGGGVDLPRREPDTK